jgi:hypothetical protein
LTCATLPGIGWASGSYEILAPLGAGGMVGHPLNASFVISPVRSYPTRNYEGFLPIAQIQPLSYSSKT